MKANYSASESDNIMKLSPVFWLMTVLFECPATLLLYAYLAGMARRCRMPRLGLAFYLLGGVACLFMALGMGMLVLSGTLHVSRTSPRVLALGACYGAACMMAAAWASAAVLALALAVLRTTSTETIADSRAEPEIPSEMSRLRPVS